MILDKLQKTDKHTKKLIKEMRKLLFSMGIRTSHERAWAILQASFKLPFEYIIGLNKEIEYQGSGVHISSKHGDQLVVVKDLGRFEVKAVGKKGKRKAAVKFVPSEDIKRLAEETIEVKE